MVLQLQNLHIFPVQWEIVLFSELIALNNLFDNSKVLTSQ